MKLKKLNFMFLILVLIFILIGIFIVSYMLKKNNNSSKIIKCNMKYGWCPAAKCIPNPYDDSKAYCMCDVKSGINYSVGNNNCENIKPYTTKFGQEVIFSDFSPNSIDYHLQKCPPQEVNMNCMNKICSVDPNNPSKAICLCDKIDNNGLEWVTFNKNGGEKLCNYQSGASIKDHEAMLKYISENKKNII